MQTAKERTRAEIVDIISVSAKGQIAIPVKIRNELAIRKGDKLLVALEGGKLLMIPARAMWERNMRDEFKDMLKLAEGAARQLWDNETDDLWNNV